MTRDPLRGAVLVAGGAGFLGSHLCELLIERSISVLCMDNLSTGSHDNIDHLADDPSFRFVEADIVDLDAREPLQLPGDTELTAIMNLASPASPPEYLRRPLETLAVGSTGTRNLLELAQRTNARFLLASTSEVYGDPLVHPQREDYWGNVNPVGPRSVYDEAKRFAEALTMAYHRHHGVEVRIARIFNTYGPRLRPDDGRVVSTLIRQALDGDALTVYGDGTQTRSFCYVDDEIRGLLTLLSSDTVDPVNVGNPNEATVLELARDILAITGSNSQILFEPLPQDDPKVRQPNIDRIKQLGWQPEIGLHDGLGRTIEWFRRLQADRQSAQPSDISD